MKNNLSIDFRDTSYPVGTGHRPEQASGIYQSGLPIFSQDWWLNIARGSSNYR